jgi:hypothetical protein
MNRLAIAITAAGLAVAGSAAAFDRVTDVDFLKASRCKGIATAVGADTTGLNAFLKSEARVRNDVILKRADDEAARGKRQAADANLKEQVAQELSSTCTAYMGAGKSVSGQ